MKYTINNKTYDELPDPCNGRSPMTDEAFVQMGGTIERGEKERVLSDLAGLLSSLAEKVEGVTVDDFKAAARTMHSGELVTWAREHGVAEDVISEARSRMLEIMADALREGMSWAELLVGAPEA